MKQSPDSKYYYLKHGSNRDDFVYLLARSLEHLYANHQSLEKLYWANVFSWMPSLLDYFFQHQKGHLVSQLKRIEQ